PGGHTRFAPRTGGRRGTAVTARDGVHERRPGTCGAAAGAGTALCLACPWVPWPWLDQPADAQARQHTASTSHPTIYPPSRTPPVTTAIDTACAPNGAPRAAPLANAGEETNEASRRSSPSPATDRPRR